MRLTGSRPVAALVGCLLLSCAARAASPVMSGIDPPGAQRGSEQAVIITGDRLHDAKGLLFYSDGIEVSDFQIVDGKKGRATLKIAPDCPLGEHQVRVWTATGVSDLHLFYVGPFPAVTEVEPNNDVAHAQSLALNVTVSGVIKNEDVDCFSVKAKKGQRITAEVEGMRLGGTMFDPWLAILGKDGKAIVSCDDCALLAQDPMVSILAPEDGVYVLQVRESTYGGSDQSRYRLHVGTFPQPTAVYPPGGKAGEELQLRFIGDVKGPFEKKIKLPALENGVSEMKKVFAEENGETAPAPNPIRVSPFPNVLETEPNNDVAHATAADLPLPLAFNGIISEKGDVDFFKFEGKKGEEFDFRVYARALRSPLDSVLCIYDAKGKQLASNDDSGGPDSYLRYRFPGDGEYYLSVTDQIKRGGPDFTYRVEVIPVAPQLVLGMTQPIKESQERQTAPVPRGNRYGAVLRAKRSDFSGELVVASNDLPPGVTMQVAPMPANSDIVPVVFEAAGNAGMAGKLSTFAVHPVDQSKKVESEFQHVIDIIPDPNNAPYLQSKVGKVAVAVTDEAPFKLAIVEPKVPIVQNGAMNLKVVVERKEGFNLPVKVSLLYKPPGIGAENQVDVPEGKTEAVIPISANGDAPVREWKIAVEGFADDGKGAVWVCSPFAKLEVAKPFVTASIERGYVEQGQSATVTCHLVQNRPFDGKAKIQLLNLPNKVASREMEVTSADTEIHFAVTAEKTSMVGQKKDLFCMLTIMQDGEPVVHNIGQGGVLRIGKAVEQK